MATLVALGEDEPPLLQSQDRSQASRSQGVPPPPPEVDVEVVVRRLRLAFWEERLEVERLLTRRHEDLISQLHNWQKPAQGTNNAAPGEARQESRTPRNAESRTPRNGESRTPRNDESRTPRKSSTDFNQDIVASYGFQGSDRTESMYASQSKETWASGQTGTEDEQSSPRRDHRNSPTQRVMNSLESNLTGAGFFDYLSQANLGNVLDIISGCIICLNVFMMAAQTEYNSYDLKELLSRQPLSRFSGSLPATEAWPVAGDIFEVLEWMFGIFFCLELVLRIVCRIHLRRDLVWNCMDFVIIVSWGVERINTFEVESSFNPTVLRVARFIRLFRLVKLLRHMSVFNALLLIIKAIQSSMSVLIWTLVLLAMLMMVIAMVNASLLESFIKDETQNARAREEVYLNWGSFIRAYVSMFEITLANWGPHCWLLMNEVDVHWGFFFIIWRCCFGFAVIQVIMAVFIQHTFKVASRDTEIMIQEKKQAGEAYINNLHSLFTSLDESGDGSITREEFDAALAQPRVRHWFAALEIDVSDVPKLFAMLDNGHSMISKEEFILGLKKVKGAAQAIDVLALTKECQKIGRAMGVEDRPAFFEEFREKKLESF